ncbi:stage II sporulation protein M [Thermococcus aggregans]|uniref:Stage II sporulation protein M n=1 Tax=Thermococcus aggregans TaxID=110163 RepID=A0A9E7SP27_THEAG|nr:stage II sporulation protein M [Thermococcus aggregans]USS41004.1 stage II sporulation protein M [Thermococcus aggregans]
MPFKHKFFLLFSLLLFLSGFLLGLSVSKSTYSSYAQLKTTNIDPILEILEKDSIGSSLTITYLFVNNARVALLLSLGGALTFGGLTFLNLVSNGMNLGVLFYEALALNDVGAFFLLILPHGIFEISALIIAGAAGFKIPYEVLMFALGKKEEIITEEDAKEFFKLVGISIVLILIAAVIEAKVTLQLSTHVL